MTELALFGAPRALLGVYDSVLDRLSAPDLDQAWLAFVAEYPATHAVTIAYNNRIAGTVDQLWRITRHGECLPLPTPGRPSRPGLNLLSSVRMIAPDAIHQDLRRLHRDIDRKLFGSHFNKRPVSKRSSFIGFIEHANDNVHVHTSWRVPEERATEFKHVVEPAWKNLVPRGSCQVRVIFDDGWGSYILKDQHHANDDPSLFVSSGRLP